jgi:hypothetical protein
MSELSTVLISNSRYNDITDRVTIGVKDGPASVIHQKYQHYSNSTSSTLFIENIPSENILIDRNIHVIGRISCYYETAIAAGETITFKVVPSSFPMNQALQSATITLNNSKVSVQTQDVLQVYLKQFDQKFLSKNRQMTPSFVDKYYGKVKDATTNDGASSYMSGVESGEKDSDTVGRFNEDYSVSVFLGDVPVAIDPITGVFTVVNGGAAASTVYVECSVNVSEPLVGLPTAEIALQSLTSSNTTEIISNDEDISTLQLLTATHTTEIISNDEDISALQLLTATHTTEIISNDEDIAALQLLTESHTTEIISNDEDIAALQLLTESNTIEISSNDTDINALQLLTSTHTTEISSKQAQITNQSNIICRDIEADNIILRPPSLFGDIDIT